MPQAGTAGIKQARAALSEEEPSDVPPELDSGMANDTSFDEAFGPYDAAAELSTSSGSINFCSDESEQDSGLDSRSPRRRRTFRVRGGSSGLAQARDDTNC